MVKLAWPQRVVLVRAVNEGSRSIELHGMTFRFVNGQELLAIPVAGRDDLQKLLGDGQSESFRYDKRTLEQAEEEAHSLIASAVVADASTAEYVALYERGPGAR